MTFLIISSHSNNSRNMTSPASSKPTNMVTFRKSKSLQLTVSKFSLPFSTSSLGSRKPKNGLPSTADSKIGWIDDELLNTDKQQEISDKQSAPLQGDVHVPLSDAPRRKVRDILNSTDPLNAYKRELLLDNNMKILDDAMQGSDQFDYDEDLLSEGDLEDLDKIYNSHPFIVEYQKAHSDASLSSSWSPSTTTTSSSSLSYSQTNGKRFRR